jgi:hypothetical protein
MSCQLMPTLIPFQPLLEQKRDAELGKRVIYAAVGPRAPLGVPVWKPFLKRWWTERRERQRPEPVVLRRLAFSPQLTVAKKKTWSVELFP